MAFRDLLLPIGIAVEWRSAAGFQTTVVRTDNGKEKRNPNWDSPLATGTFNYNALKPEQAQVVDEMFAVCMGRAHTFKVRDPRKFMATATEGKFVGSQAVLRVTRGAYTLDKPITKLDASVVLTGSGTIDYNTGLILTGAPTAWAGKFYLCMRFDVDELETDGVGRAPNGDLIVVFKDVPLVEVLGE